MRCSSMRNSFGGDKIGSKTREKSGEIFFFSRDLKTKSNLEDKRHLKFDLCLRQALLKKEQVDGRKRT